MVKDLGSVKVRGMEMEMEMESAMSSEKERMIVTSLESE